VPLSDANTTETSGVLQVLLAEQKHIDAQIETMMDLQIKMLAVLFPALAVAAGWIFSSKDKPPLSPDAQGGALIILIAAMCFGILLSVICYSISAEYSRYKSQVLGPHLERLLNSPNPLDGHGWGRSDTGRTLGFAIACLWTTIAAALFIALAVATKLVWMNPTSRTLRISLFLSYAISTLALLSVVFSLVRGAKAPLAARRLHDDTDTRAKPRKVASPDK
jgi:hypothetical protein